MKTIKEFEEIKLEKGSILFPKLIKAPKAFEKGDELLLTFGEPMTYKLPDLINNRYPFERDFLIYSGNCPENDIVIKKDKINEMLKEIMQTEEETLKIIPCELCNEKITRMTGTRRCDRCWELEYRIEMDLELTKKIIKRIEGEKT